MIIMKRNKYLKGYSQKVNMNNKMIKHPLKENFKNPYKLTGIYQKYTKRLKK